MISDKCPLELKTYLKKRIRSSLDTWTTVDDTEKEIAADNVVENIIDSVPIDEGNLKKYRKDILASGTIISKHFQSSKQLDFNKIKHGNMNDFLTASKIEYQKGVQIFTDIADHHKNLTLHVKDWDEDDKLIEESALKSYSFAAEAMGTKAWVIEGNLWMQGFMISYFRLGAAKRLYLKELRAVNRTVANNRFDVRIDGLYKTLANDLFSDNQITNQAISHFDRMPLWCLDRKNDELLRYLQDAASNYTPIRVVDVGSCYNPIAKGPFHRLFDVTALDLCPTNGSVFTCDFLKLRFGSRLSAPISVSLDSSNTSPVGSGSIPFTDTTTTEAMAPSSSSSSSSPSGDCDNSARRLIQLPSFSYHAVTMSLVLNYLPTPAARLAMIRQARRYAVLHFLIATYW